MSVEDQIKLNEAAKVFLEYKLKEIDNHLYCSNSTLQKYIDSFFEQINCMKNDVDELIIIPYKNRYQELLKKKKELEIKKKKEVKEEDEEE